MKNEEVLVENAGIGAEGALEEFASSVCSDGLREAEALVRVALNFSKALRPFLFLDIKLRGLPGLPLIYY